MFCSVCGAQNTEQVRFCRACGKPLSTTNNLAQSGANDDPFQTRLAIPVEHSSIKQQPPVQPARPSAPPPDPFATMVAMPAANISKSAPPASSSEPVDPFATQVSPAFDAGQLAKELAKVKKPAPPPPSADEMMKTVVGGMAPIPRPPAPQTHSDPMATVVGMPAINPLPTKPPAPAPSKPAENEKKPAAAQSSSASQSNNSQSNASQNSPFAQKSMPQNYDPFSTMSHAGEKKGKGMIIGIVVVVVIILVVAAVMFMQR